jgi:hypothetical protein
VEVACVKSGGGQDAQQSDRGINLPWSGQDRGVSTRIGLSCCRFVLPFPFSRMT